MSKNINYNIKVGVIGDAQLQKFQRTVEKINKSTAKSTKSIAKMSKSLDILGNTAKIAGTAMAVFYAAKGVTNIVKQADAIRNLEASFASLTGSAESGADMLDRVFSIAKETGAPLDDVGNAVQKLTVGMSEMGASNEQIARVAESFLKIGKIGGTELPAVTNALIQFSQGLSSGRLQGDEFKSMAENMPLVLRELAKEFNIVNEDMDVTIGQLKQLAADGLITAEIMANSLIRAGKDTDETFAKLPRTFEMASNNFKTMLLEFSRSEAMIVILDSVAAAMIKITTVVENVVTNLKRFSDWIGESEIRIKAFQAVLIAVGLAFALAFPVVTAAAAIASFVVYVINNFDKIRNNAERMTTNLVLDFKEKVNAIQEFFAYLPVVIAQAFDFLWNNAISPVLTKLLGALSKLTSAISSIESIAPEWIIKLDNDLKNLTATMAEGAKGAEEAGKKYKELVSANEDDLKPTIEKLEFLNLEAMVLAGSFDGISGSVESMDESIQNSLGGTVELLEGTGNAANEVSKAFSKQSKEIAESLPLLTEQLKLMEKGVDASDALAKAKEKLENSNYRKDLEDNLKNLSLTNEEYLELRTNLGAFEKLTAMVAEQAFILAEGFDEAWLAALNLSQEDMSALVNGVNQAGVEALKTAQRLGLAADEAKRLVDAASDQADVNLDAFGGKGNSKYDKGQTIKNWDFKAFTEKASGGSDKAKSKLEEFTKAIEATSDPIKNAEKEMNELTKTFEELELSGLITSEDTEMINKYNAKIAEMQGEFVELQNEANGVNQAMDIIEGGMSTAFGEIIDGSKSAKDAFSDMAISILNSIAQMALEILVIKPLMDSLKSSFGSIGAGGFSFFGLPPEPTSVATATVPTQAYGVGRTPTASMSASIMKSATLSRSSSGSGINTIASPVNVNITNNSKNEVEVAETIGNDGSRTLEVLIEGKVKDAFSSGRMDKSMKMNYGVRRVGS